MDAGRKASTKHYSSVLVGTNPSPNHTSQPIEEERGSYSEGGGSLNRDMYYSERTLLLSGHGRWNVAEDLKSRRDSLFLKEGQGRAAVGGSHKIPQGFGLGSPNTSAW